MNEYREGKVKSTPMRRVKEFLNPCAYKRSEPCFSWLRRAFCIMNLRVTVTSEVNCHEAGSRSESEPEEGAQFVVVDAKPSDLHMSRMKFR